MSLLELQYLHIFEYKILVFFIAPMMRIAIFQFSRKIPVIHSMARHRGDSISETGCWDVFSCLCGSVDFKIEK